MAENMKTGIGVIVVTTVALLIVITAMVLGVTLKHLTVFLAIFVPVVFLVRLLTGIIMCLRSSKKDSRQEGK